MAPDFAGKTALITGAGRGIGRAIALGLADAGASLILIARSTRQLAETRAMLTARGAASERIRILPADLGDEEQRTRAAVAALGPGRVDILIVMGKKTEEVPVYFPGTTAHVISGLRWWGRSYQTAVDRVGRHWIFFSSRLAMRRAQGRSARAWRSPPRCAKPPLPGVSAAATVSQKARK